MTDHHRVFGDQQAYTYRAYGLNIRSERPLPELIPYSAIADVSIRWGKVNRLSQETTAGCYIGGEFQATKTAIAISWPQFGNFRVQDGREIWVEPAAEIQEKHFRRLLLGPVLSALLWQRGLLTLHASAVAINGKAVVFLGTSRSGKSTTAALLHARGWDFITDDMVVLDLSRWATPIVLPSFPEVRLWQNSAHFLGYTQADLSEGAGVEKLNHAIANRFVTAPLPLDRIYIMAEGSQLRSVPLDPKEAIFQLLEYTYPDGEFIQATGCASRYFQQCMALVRQIPICYLERQKSLSVLPEVAELIEKDLSGGVSHTASERCCITDG